MKDTERKNCEKIIRQDRNHDHCYKVLKVGEDRGLKKVDVFKSSFMSEKISLGICLELTRRKVSK